MDTTLQVQQWEERVKQLLIDKDNHKAAENESEKQLMIYLYNLRGIIPVDTMSDTTGWSRQTLYNKWKKYGFNTEE